MPSEVLHQPRIAWDTALALVGAAQAEAAVYGWCRDRLAAVLGPQAAADLARTREHLATTPGASPVEAGMWRVRLEDALRSEPDTGPELRRLAADARTRLR